MADVYILNLISYHSLMRNSMYSRLHSTVQKGTGCHLQTHTDTLTVISCNQCPAFEVSFETVHIRNK